MEQQWLSIALSLIIIITFMNGLASAVMPYACKGITNSSQGYGACQQINQLKTKDLDQNYSIDSNTAKTIAQDMGLTTASNIPTTVLSFLTSAGTFVPFIIGNVLNFATNFTTLLGIIFDPLGIPIIITIIDIIGGALFAIQVFCVIYIFILVLQVIGGLIP